MISGGQLVDVEHLSLPQSVPADAPVPTVDPAGGDERGRILGALMAARWNRREAARRLGMPYSTLRYKIKKLDIS